MFMARGKKKVTICKPWRDDSGEINPVGAMILDFQPLEQWENKFLLFKSLSLWYFVMVVQIN